MNKLTIVKTSGNLGRRQPVKDMYSGLLAGGVAVTGGVQLDQTYRLQSVDDARALGIDADYDTNNGILVYEHIAEFFRINPDGVLFLRLIDPNTALADYVSTGGALNRLLNDAGGDIRQVGIVFNKSGVTESDVIGLVGQAQSFADYAATHAKPLQLILEGYGVSKTTTHDLHSLNAPNVSVMIGQNMAVANNTINPQPDYAAVGTLLGAVSRARVNESVAWVEKFNLQGGALLSPGIDATPVTDINEGELEALDEKGYIFFRLYTGIAGIYLNDSYTATAVTDDYAYIESNRTMDKAIREVRAVLLPRLGSPVKVDAETGRMSPEVVKSFENDAKRALERMLSEGEISGLEVYIDPEQDIIGTSELKVQIGVVPTGTARMIKVEIGFSNPAQ